ncbi:MAG TPA: WD40 repeat domain-containing protein [Pyrinomonadaceae bacterium]|nr:WD40 repeat domain-containing protein [Pyrinomonadaceae bacterium]HMP67049.1 WD40 repeat domain-containing protein [Pyrinomonadaceae bacterium]
MLLSYSSGNQDLCLWDVRSGKLLWKRPISFIQKADEYYTLNSLAWSPDESLIATGSANGTVQLWNTKTGNFLWRADVHQNDITAIKFSPDGKTIATTALSDKSALVKLIRVSDGKTTQIYEGNPCAGIAIAFDEQAGKLRMGNLDGNVTEWNLVSGKQTDDPVRSCQLMRTYDWETSFSDDLSLAIKRTGESEVTLKNTRSGEHLRSLTIRDSRIRSTISKDRKKAVVSKYGGFSYIDLNSFETAELDGCVSGNVFDLDHNGGLFAQSCDGHNTSIKITDISKGKSWFLDGHPSYIHAISYSPDGKVLAFAGNDRNIYLLDPANRAPLKTLSGHDDRVTAIAFSPEGNKLLSGDGHSVIKLWDTSSGKLLNSVKASDRRDDVEKIEFTKDGNAFLVLINGSLSLWDATSLKPRILVKTADGYESTGGYMTFGYSSVPINSAAFSADGGKVITGHADGTIRLWDPDTGKELNKFKIAQDVSFVFPAPDGKKIVAIIENEKREKNIQLIEMLTGKVLGRSSEIEITYLEKAAISQDGNFLAAVGNIGDIEIWNVRDLSRVYELDHELSGDDAVAFSSDSKTFFIGGKNQNLLLYDTASGKKLWQLIPPFQPGDAEQRLADEKRSRIAALTEIKRNREKQAAIDRELFREKVYVAFSHFGDMSDPGEKRLVEPNELNESKIRKRPEDANAVWLRLYNDSPLPIAVPTQSMSIPNRDCFHLFPDGQKMLGFCDDREVSIRFGVKDRNDEWVPYGYHFGSVGTVLPGKYITFPVPLKILQEEHTILFSFVFQNVRASENERSWDYGEKIELHFNKNILPK